MNLIVAVDENWAIGKGGDQLVYISEDLKRFKALTTGHPVILGRKTLATFPGGRPLKGRRNLIVSRNPDFAPEGAEVYPDLEQLLEARKVLEQGHWKQWHKGDKKINLPLLLQLTKAWKPNKEE